MPNLLVQPAQSDVSAIAVKNGVPIAPTVVVIYAGSVAGKGSPVYRNLFVRWDLTGIPAGSTINGCSVEFTSNTTRAAATTANVEFGWLKDDGKWTASGGFTTGNYASVNELPMARWGAGVSTDVTVWEGEAPGGTLATMPATSSGVKISFGDGTGVSPTDTVTGLTAQLQAAFDARGVDDAPVCFHICRIYDGNNTKQMDFRSNETATATQKPALYVNWTPPDPTSSFVVNPQAQDGGVTDMTVDIEGTFVGCFGGDVGSLTTWTSSIAGLLTTGTDLLETDLVVGAHTMTVVATSRYLNSGQDETNFDNSPISEGTFSGGTGHAASDVITLDTGETVTVDAVSSGVVTQFTLSEPVADDLQLGQTLSQSSTTGSGTGFSLLVENGNMTAQTDTTQFTITVYDIPDEMAEAIAAARSAGDQTSLQIAGGFLSAGAGGGSGEKGIAVIDALP